MTTAAEPPLEEQAAERTSQGCAKCDVVDDHPRHHLYFAIQDPREPGKVLDLSEAHHFDCGAANGCQHCQEVMDASDSAHGQELIQHLTSQPPATEE